MEKHKAYKFFYFEGKSLEFNLKEEKKLAK
jgi:hypothetical protein